MLQFCNNLYVFQDYYDLEITTNLKKAIFLTVYIYKRKQN